MNTIMNKCVDFLKEWRLYLFFALFSFCILFIISPDSYTHDSYNRVDPAWFFMCGKAWMNGLVPYVDFADSKGPLLWLLYGMGYLISHYNYHGVFWISWVWYVLIFIFTYRTAFIFLQDRKKSFVTTILMSLSFFNAWFNGDFRGENAALLFMVVSLYYSSKTIYEEKTERSVYRTYFILGICFASTLLIKFNIAVMQCIYTFYLLYFCYRKGYSICYPILIAALGVMAIVLPFLVYFAVIGNIDAFIQEYFINTTRLVGGDMLRGYIVDWWRVMATPSRLILLVVIASGALLVKKRINEHRYFPLVTSLFVFALAVKNSFASTYLSICSYLALWFLIVIIYDQQSLTRKKQIALICVVFFYCSASNIFDISASHSVFFRHCQEKEHFEKVSEIMSRVKNPSIINACVHEAGYGIGAHSLPACKYWALQTGAYPEMLKEHRESILSGKSNFIYILDVSYLRNANITLKDILSAGYHICYQWENGVHHCYLLSNVIDFNDGKDVGN